MLSTCDHMDFTQELIQNHISHVQCMYFTCDHMCEILVVVGEVTP